MNILLMDDDIHVRITTKSLLEHLGHSVCAVDEGNAAIDAYRESLIANSPYDLVILDFSVSDGLGGEETLKVLRGIDPDAKVFVSSGFTDSYSENEFAELGFDDFIHKPLSIARLRDSLDKIKS